LGAFAAMLDDAAVFPPGDLPLGEAVTAHRGHRRSGYAGLVGSLVLPGASLGAAALLLADEADPVPLSVTLPVSRGRWPPPWPPRPGFPGPS
jgi:hypothetical protein